MKRPMCLLVGVVSLSLLCGLACGQTPYGLSLDFYTGWQGGQRQTLTAESDGPFPGALFRSVELGIPNRGLWLGAGVDAKIRGDLNLFVQGWFFVPSDVEGSILLDPGATPRKIPADVNSHIDWWYIDAFGALRLSGPFSVVLGLRFDHQNYFTDDPELLNIIFFPLPNVMRLDLNVLSTIPYLGLQWGPSNGLTLRAVYSSLGWVNLKSTLSQDNSIFRPENFLGGQDNLTKRDFFELFGEYSAQLGPFMQLAVFGKGTWLSGTTDTTLTESLVNGAAEYKISYRRCGWTIGARGTVLFSLPEFLYPWR